MGSDCTESHRHQDRTNKGRDTGDRNFEDDADFIDDIPDSNQHTGSQTFCFFDQFRSSFFQTVSFQCTGENHQNDGDQLVTVCYKGCTNRGQQIYHIDSAAYSGYNGRYNDDGDRFQFQCETNDNNNYAK